MRTIEEQEPHSTVTWKGLLTGTVLDAVAELNEKILNVINNIVEVR